MVLRSAGVLALVALAGACGPSLALAPDAATPDACEPQHVPGLGTACLLRPGLYRLVLRDGTVLHTHGPDPAADDGAGFGPDAPRDAPLCADAPHMHVLYGYPTGSRDRSADVVKEIREAVRRMNAVMRADAMESGGVTADYRVKCDAEAQIAVDSFQGPATGSSPYTVDFDNVVGAARAAGFGAPATNYLVFYDGAPQPGICGVGSNSQDDRLAANNGNLKGPNYALVFDGCWSGRTPMHENGHNMGAVQRLAPFSDLSGHCLEGYDVMCYTGEVLPLCAGRTRFDCNHDTYFSANPPPGSWLATHWNIGSRLNPYLAFSDAPPPAAPPEAAQPAPEANRTQEATNSTAPVAPSPEPARANETLAPQALPDAKEPDAVAMPYRTEVPGLLPAAVAFALAVAAATRPPRKR
jgi:hypothetical protein